MNHFNQQGWPWGFSDGTDPYSPFPSNDYSASQVHFARSMAAYQTHYHGHLVRQQQMSRPTESKSRLSKDEVDVLEAEFQKNHKPNSSTKKTLADSMRVDVPRINVSCRSVCKTVALLIHRQNWFQNRRAKEKRDRNVVSYEAQRKLEKENSGGDPEYQKPLGDLVASTAPFPNTQGPSYSQSVTANLEEASNAVPESENVAPYQSAHPTTMTPETISPGLPTNAAFSEKQNLGGLLGHINGEPSGTISQNVGSFGFTTDSLQNTSSQLRSPPAIDIASRRNRRPAPISINPSRSSVMKSGLDLGKKMDGGNPTRRVSPASGANRVYKSTTNSQGSSWVQIMGDAYKQKQSQVLYGTKNINTPPTPDTPVDQLSLGGTIAHVNSNSDSRDRRLTASDPDSYDPNMRTPPTTPGGTENFFNYGTAYDMSLVSSMASFSNPGIPIQTYYSSANDGSSQPQTPSFSAQASLAYTDFFGDYAAYHWPDSSASGNSSPAQNL